MAPITPTIEPSSVTAGATWRWDMSSSTYPSDTYTLSYAIRGRDALVWSAAWAVDTDGVWAVTIPAATTALITAGAYEITRVWTNGAVVYLEQLPTLTVAPNPLTAAPGDRVAFAEANLAAVEKAITARLAGDQPEEYMIGGRSVKRMTLLDLKKTRRELQDEVFRLRSGGQTRRRLIRFTQAGA